jgi:uncharacterized protein
MTTQRAIAEFLAHPSLAVIGVSRSGRKFGNTASRVLREKGYVVYPIHPSATEIDGVTCYRRFSDLPEPVECALVVVPPANAIDVIRAAAAAGVRHVWLQPGAESPAAEATASTLGVNLIAGECILMFARPTGIHKFHLLCRRAFGRPLPTSGTSTPA